MIVLLESAHPDDSLCLERADEVRVMANPTELDGDVPLEEVRVVLTRGRGTDHRRHVPSPSSTSKLSGGAGQGSTISTPSPPGQPVSPWCTLQGAPLGCQQTRGRC